MTLEELENTPPHDAEVQRSAVDYEHRKVTFALAMWVGDMDDLRNGGKRIRAVALRSHG
jgi:hypothetical protein